MTPVRAALGDLSWGGTFAARHVFILLALAALPALQRVLVAVKPDSAILHAWPVELVVVGMRFAALIVIAGIAWREVSSDGRRPSEVPAAVASYARDQPARLVAGILLATLVLALAYVLFGPALEVVVQASGADQRGVPAAAFAARNLVTIPLVYVAVCAVLRPSVLAG